MSEIKDTENVCVTDKPDEIRNEGREENEVDNKLDSNYNEYLENDKSKDFQYDETSNDSKFEEGRTEERKCRREDWDDK